jgi:F-box and WD-40 domain protein CDC4
MCRAHGFEDFDDDYPMTRWHKNEFPVWREDFSYREHYKMSHITMTNWRNGGSLLQSHRLPVASSDNGVVTSLALDRDWIVVGLANSKIHIFSAKTGVLARTLVGHDMGVWGVCLVSKGGYPVKPPPIDARKKKKRDVDSISASLENLNIAPTQEQYVSPSLRAALGLRPEADWSRSREALEDHPQTRTEEFPGKRSDSSFASQGWGQPNSLVVSGGCDKVLRVWDIKTGYVHL